MSEFTLEQQFDRRNWQLAADKMSYEQALAVYFDALRYYQVKSNFNKHLMSSDNAANVGEVSLEQQLQRVLYEQSLKELESKLIEERTPRHVIEAELHDKVKADLLALLDAVLIEDNKTKAILLRDLTLPQFA